MKTVGQMLKDQRDQKKLTLEDIHKFIKIHPSFLTALEEGNYDVFSGKIHAKGFLKIYAEFLDLNVDQILALWRREYEIEFDKRENKFDKTSISKSIKENPIKITSGVVTSIIILLLVGLFFGYLYFQYKSYAGVPNLEIFHPENSVVVTSDILDITGKTDLDSVIYINNQRVFINTDGTFASSLKLNEGLNTVNISSINRIGKETSQIRTIIYRPIRQENTMMPTEDETIETTPSEELSDEELPDNLESPLEQEVDLE